MAVRSSFTDNMSAADARDTLNAMLADVKGLKNETTPTPTPTPTPAPTPSPSPSPSPTPGAGKTFGPTDGNSPPAFNTERTANLAEFIFTPGSQLVDLEVGGTTSSMSDCTRLYMTDDTIFQLQRVRGGAGTPIVGNVGIKPTAGQKVSLWQNDDLTVTVYLDGVYKSGAPAADTWPSAEGKAPGTFGRVNTTYANPGTVTKGVFIGPVN